MSTYKIGNKSLTVSIVSDIIKDKKKLKLDSNAERRIKNCRNYLNKKMVSSEDPIYGINTGFGSLCEHKINNKDLCKLQENLVLSHACGTGGEVPIEIVKIMLILKIQSLSYGNSGVQILTVQRLIDMFNNDVLPVVYEQGSLGASGDLSPLAHMCLPLLGKGYVNIKSNNGDYKKSKSALVFNEKNWDLIQLQSKEGLALLNGTQFMTAYGVWSLLKAQKISYFSDLISSISLDAFNGRSECFDELIQKVRPHKGQQKTAQNIRNFLSDSELQSQNKDHVQDPYSFRCIPQVHGATKDVITHVLDIFNTEINSVTDNPIIFVSEDKIISGGNFHGQTLAMSMDYLAIALSEIASISERRIYQLISGKRGLPPFLVADPGINSGMMIPQYTAASIVSQNKQLATPASVDSIVSSNGQEDHVSMGANSATKLYSISKNVEKVLAIELMNASQAISFRQLKSSTLIENLLLSYRKEVKFLKEDRLLYDDINKSILFLQNLNLDN